MGTSRIFSRKLDKAQVSYSAFDRDLLAAFFAIWHFRFQLEGREFQLLTDHRPLPQALNRFSDPWSLRQQCQLSYIAEYTTDIRMYQGWTTLSLTLYPAQPPSSLRQVLCSSHRRLAFCARPPAAVISSLQPLAAGRFPHSPPSTSTSCPALLSAFHSSPPILIACLDMAAMAAGQVSCPEVEALKARPSLRVSMATFGELQLLCDFSTGLPRPLLPPPFRMAAFTAVHSLAHPGIRATQRLMSSRWVLTGMGADMARWCRDCQSCQRAKVTKKPRATIQPMGIPAQLFSHLHIDLVGPLPRRDTTTSSPSWTDRPVGWRPFPSPAPPQRPSPKLLWPAGWPDSAFRSTSPPTGGHSSVQRCGPSSHATSATCTISPQPTIPRPTAWWKDAPANSRTLSVPAPLSATGCLIFFGSFWNFELLQRSTQVFLQLRWLMAPPWSCPARYPVSLSHRWRCLKRTSAWRHHSSHLGVLLLLLLTSTRSCSSSRRQLLSTFAEAAPSRHSHQRTAGHL